MLKRLAMIGFVLAPALTTISCSQSLTINSAYQEISNAQKYFDEIKSSQTFEEYNDQDVAFYINYLLNHKDSDNPVFTNGSNYIEVRLHLPFIPEKSDITEGTVGRVVTIPHGGHFHYIYKTWEQLAPQPWELEETKSYATFILPVVNERISWDDVEYHNDLIEDRDSLSSSGEKVNLEKGNDAFEINDHIAYWYEEKTTSWKLFQDLVKRSLSLSDATTYFTDITGDFNTYANRDFITNKDIAQQIIEADSDAITIEEFKILISKLEFDFDVWETTSEYRQADVLLYTIFESVKDGEDSYLDEVYYGSEFIEYDWAYNQVVQGIPLSSPALEFQYSLLDTMSNEDSIQNQLGTKIFYGSNEMFDWWQQARPHVQAQELMIDPEILLNANRSLEDEEIFWNYLKMNNIYDEVKSQISDYRNPLPSNFHNDEAISFNYYDNLDTGERTWLMDYGSIVRNSIAFFHISPPFASSSSSIFERNEWEWINKDSESPIPKIVDGKHNDAWRGRQAGAATNSSWSSQEYVEFDMPFSWEQNIDTTINDIEYPFINTEQYLNGGEQLYYVTNRMIFETKDEADKLISTLGGNNDNTR